MNDFNLFDQANNFVDESAIRAAAETTYQLFKSYCEAGFSKTEALYLLGYIITHPIQNGGNEK